MSSLADPSAAIEKRVNVRSFSGLGVALARSLGEAGIGGAAIGKILETSLEGECVACGMEISGADLIAASAMPHQEGEWSEKHRRLHLGYCARKTCLSDYYVLRMGTWPDIQWNVVWERSEELLAQPATGREAAPSDRRHVLQWAKGLLPRLRQPLPIGVIVVLTGLLFVRSGCRIPGITPAPRVFIVPELGAAPSSGTRR